MQKLGKNIDGYKGERIDITSVLHDMAGAAGDLSWVPEILLAENGIELATWRRPSAHARARVYVSAGIHGDEPAGPLAARRLLLENRWPGDVEVWLCPCLNPSGFLLNRRENAQGQDLNRQYLHLEAPETRAHVAWLQRQPSFDVTLCLHEDWESLGFYLYEVNLDQRRSHAEEIIRRVAAVCPIDPSPAIEGRPANDGVIRPSADPRSRPQWPEAFWLITHKTHHSYTLEAPSDFALETRIAALVAGVHAVLDQL